MNRAWTRSYQCEECCVCEHGRKEKCGYCEKQCAEEELIDVVFVCVRSFAKDVPSFSCYPYQPHRRRDMRENIPRNRLNSAPRESSCHRNMTLVSRAETVRWNVRRPRRSWSIDRSKVSPPRLDQARMLTVPAACVVSCGETMSTYRQVSDKDLADKERTAPPMNNQSQRCAEKLAERCVELQSNRPVIEPL